MSIWQEMVDRHGFTGAYESVKRFVRKLRGLSSPEARAVITTAPGEDYGKFRIMVRSGAALSFSARNVRRVRDCALHNALQSFEPLDEA